STPAASRKRTASRTASRSRLSKRSTPKSRSGCGSRTTGTRRFGVRSGPTESKTSANPSALDSMMVSFRPPLVARVSDQFGHTPSRQVGAEADAEGGQVQAVDRAVAVLVEVRQIVRVAGRGAE